MWEGQEESAADSVDYNKTNVKDHIKGNSINAHHSQAFDTDFFSSSQNIVFYLGLRMIISLFRYLINSLKPNPS